MRIGRMLNLRQFRHQLVIAVPLDEVGPAHERAMLRRPPVVMPHVEVGVLERLIEWLLRQLSVRMHLIDDALRLLYDRVRRRDLLFGLNEEEIDARTRVALETDLL